ncbi:hypothetical protein QE152_g26779 [Popillia japonica]|uniref:Uncharacterized protein n=1 Tax=Popillia japonica TaxID=7064 RepID=A0AAW1JX87_POPJA
MHCKESSYNSQLLHGEQDPTYSVTVAKTHAYVLPLVRVRQIGQWYKWYNERDSDTLDVEDSSDIVSDHESDSEQSADDEILVSGDDLMQQSLSSEKKIAINGPLWNQLQMCGASAIIIVLTLPGLKGEARYLGHEANTVKIWNLLFTEVILAIIVTWTNKKLEQMPQKYNNPTRVDLRNTTNNEIRAFFELLVYTAIFKSNDEDIDALLPAMEQGAKTSDVSRAEKGFLILCTYYNFFMFWKFVM